MQSKTIGWNGLKSILRITYSNQNKKSLHKSLFLYLSYATKSLMFSDEVQSHSTLISEKVEGIKTTLKNKVQG